MKRKMVISDYEWNRFSEKVCNLQADNPTSRILAKFDSDDTISSYLQTFAFIESRGNRYARSSSNACGLFQFKRLSASQILRRYVATHSKDDKLMKFLELRHPNVLSQARSQKYDNHITPDTPDGSCCTESDLFDPSFSTMLFLAFLDLLCQERDIDLQTKEGFMFVAYVHHHGLSAIRDVNYEHIRSDDEIYITNALKVKYG